MSAESGVARQLADDLWLIDTLFQGERDIIASYLLVGSGGLALVDVGSAASMDQLLAGVRAAGFDPSEITRLLLTHVHLDHAGASGPLVRAFPQGAGICPSDWRAPSYRPLEAHQQRDAYLW